MAKTKTPASLELDLDGLKIGIWLTEVRDVAFRIDPCDEGVVYLSPETAKIIALVLTQLADYKV